MSCAADRQEQTRIYERAEDGSSIEWRMAGVRSINTELLNKDLSNMIADTKAIESQIKDLQNKLENLRSQIALTSAIPFKDNAPVADEAPQTIVPSVQEDAHLEDKAKIITENVKPQQKPSVQKSSPKTKTALKSGVNSVRTGVHKDKTRLVFDINGSTKHTTDFDKELGLLTVTLPQTQWGTTTTQAYRLPQLSGYEAKNSGQGSIVALSLKGVSSVKTSTIQKTGVRPARLVIDLMK